MMNKNDSDEMASNEGDDEEYHEEPLVRVNKSQTMTLADWFLEMKPYISNMKDQNAKVFKTICD